MAHKSDVSSSSEDMDLVGAEIHWIDHNFFEGRCFVSLEVIGEGYTANVHRAVDMRKRSEVGVKLIRKAELTSSQYNRLRTEIEVWEVCSASCENIVQLLEVFDSPEELAFVMELAEMDLWDAVKYRTIPKEKVGSLFAQAVEAIWHMHSLGYVHRDLKLENLLYKDGIVKVCDFGFSCRYSEDNKLQDSLGTLYYSSPEIVNGTHYKGPEVDVWALGVILYALLLGEYPFFEPSKEETREVIRQGDYAKGKRFRRLPSEVRELIDTMLAVNPKKRISIEEVHDHPFVARGRRDCSLYHPKLSNTPSSTTEKHNMVNNKPAGVSTVDIGELQKKSRSADGEDHTPSSMSHLPAEGTKKKKGVLNIPRLLLAKVFASSSGAPTYG